MEQTQYEKQINRLKSKGFKTKNIEDTIEKAENSIESGENFVIYGEPQSGKTEMMICLTAKLLDEGKKMVIILLNDSVSLLNQNLKRFSTSTINPSPKNFDTFKDPDEYYLLNHPCVIFCKKNSKNLNQLIRDVTNNCSDPSGLVVIDDEGDYATPDSKVNKKSQEASKIHALVEQLLEEKGQYIGVTATPGRLDLNDTFSNKIDKWVCFKPHSEYIGHKVFFPNDDSYNFHLEIIPNADDSPQYLFKALYNFLATVGYLNTIENNSEKNYSILIHTDGKKEIHREDKKRVSKFLKNVIERKESAIKKLKECCDVVFPTNSDKIYNYIIDNIARNNLIVMNSDLEKHYQNNKSATIPEVPFTIVIGGNIVSRGITFENLLSMFFTRTAKTIQQDTYIQRARMFGNRKEYLERFTLYITKDLYSAWSQCFRSHDLSLRTIENGVPLWIKTSSSRPVSPSSMKKNVIEISSGELMFNKFEFNKNAFSQNQILKGEKALKDLFNKIDIEEGLKKSVLDFVISYKSNDADICIHPPINIESRKKDKSVDIENIYRPKGLMGGDILHKGVYHFRIYYNPFNKARLYYRCYDKNRLKFIRRKKALDSEQ